MHFTERLHSWYHGHLSRYTVDNKWRGSINRTTVSDVPVNNKSSTFQSITVFMCTINYVVEPLLQPCELPQCFSAMIQMTRILPCWSHHDVTATAESSLWFLQHGICMYNITTTPAIYIAIPGSLVNTLPALLHHLSIQWPLISYRWMTGLPQ